MLRRDFLQLFPALVCLGLHLPDSGATPFEPRLQRYRPPAHPESNGLPQLISERGHLFDCSSCLFARKGRNVVTGGIGDETAILWDATTAKELRRFNHRRQIWDLAINPKHDQLLTCGADREAKLWDLATGGLLQRFRKHTDVVMTAAFDASGETVFTIGQDCLICVWSPHSSKPHHSFRMPFRDLQAAGFDAGGTTVIGRFKDKSLKVFNPQNGKFLKDLQIPKTDPRAINEGLTEHPIVVSRDGSLVAAHALYSGLVVYDIASGQQLWSHPFLGDIAMAFTFDSSRLLVMSSEFDSLSQTAAHTTRDDFGIETSRISFFKARSGEIEDDVAVYHGHYKDALRTQNVAFRPDGEAFVAADSSGIARVFQVSDGKELLRLRRDNHPISSIAVSPDGTSLVVADSRPDIGILDLTVGAFVGSLGPLEIQAKSVRFTKDGKAVVADENNLFRTWDTSNRKPLVHLNRQTEQGWLYPVRDDGALALRFPAQGPHVDPANAFAHSTLLSFSIWSRSISVTVCNPQSQQDMGGFLLTADNFGPALFGPDGESVFAILGDRVAKLDLRAPKLSWTTPPQKDNINDLAVSTDGRVLTAGNDGFAMLWNANTGALIHRLKAHPDGVTAVAFSPDGNYLLTGGIDGNASLWSSDGVRSRLLTGHSADVTSAAFVPNHGFVATGSSDGTVRLWTVPEGSWVCTLRRTELGGWAVAAPDGRFDTDNLDEVKGLHWVFNDDPYHALAPEQYLRDFYEPGLLSRLLVSTTPHEFRAIRSLQSLNRAVPQETTDTNLAR